MATRAISYSKHFRGAHSWTWTGLLNGDDGAPLDPDGGGIAFGDKTVQVTGTFGAGGNLQVQGSNDGTNWTVLTDPQGNALDFGSAGIKVVLENPLYVRPLVTAGDGTTNLTVVVSGRAFLQLR